jgi:hypothetical protein
MSQFEDYLQGKPLTPELARLAAGEEMDEPDESLRMPSKGEKKPIDDDDREHLRRLKLEPGWPVLQQLLDRHLRIQEDAAKEHAKAYPHKVRTNAANWARVAALEETRRVMGNLMEAEIAKLMESKAGRE